MEDLTKEFLAESAEGLDRMERDLTELELRPGDRELLQEIFRTVHTIKGSTGFLGFGRLESLAHAGESLLGKLRDGSLLASPGVITVLLKLLDRLRQIVGLIREYGHEGVRREDIDRELIELLDACASRETTACARTLSDAAELEPEAGLPADGSIPSAAGAIPSAAGADGQQSAVATQRPPAHDLRVPIEVLNRLMHLVGELVLTRNQLLEPEQRNAPLAPALGSRLDTLVNGLRETVMEARLQPLANLFGRMPRMVRDLARECGREVALECTGHDTALDRSLLEAIRDPLTHAIRNAIDHGIEAPHQRRQAGKADKGTLRLSAFHSHGRVVIEIADDGRGIVGEHILELAIARGLVTPAAGATLTPREKLELVFLPGFSTAASVTSISGRGVGMDVVRANVEKVGGSVELESTPGLGTVVRLRVPLTLAIVPAILVRSGGTRFCLPQSALTELVYVPAVVPAQGPAMRAACVAPGSGPDRGKSQENFDGGLVTAVGEARLYSLRDELLPVVWLDDLLALPRARPAHGFYLAVLEAAGARFGLAVDELLAPEEIVVKPLSDVIGRLGVFSGATMLGCGTLALILEAKAIAARAGVRAGDARPAAPLARAADPRQMYVVFSFSRLPAAERFALPLAAVERLEEVPTGSIEHFAGRPVLRHQDQVLPLVDPGGLLSLSQPLEPSGTAVPAYTMLLCRPGPGVRYGLLVEQVLEVTDGQSIPAAEGLDGPSDFEALVVAGRLATLHSSQPVAEVHQVAGVQPIGALQPVAAMVLGEVA